MGICLLYTYCIPGVPDLGFPFSSLPSLSTLRLRQPEPEISAQGAGSLSPGLGLGSTGGGRRDCSMVSGLPVFLAVSPAAQIFQEPLIKEFSANHIGVLDKI